MTHGELIRKLREERNISQRKLTNGICPRSTLSSLELNGRQINAELLIKFLDRMNVRLDEYWRLYHSEDFAKEHSFNRLIDLDLQNDQPGLQQLYQEIDSNYQDSQDVYWRLARFKTQETLAKYQPDFSYQAFGDTAKSEIDFFIHYLGTINDWSLFELATFGNLLQYLPESFVEVVTASLLKKVDLNIQQHREVYLRTIFNVTGYYIEHRQFKTAIKNLKQLDKLLTYQDLHWSLMKRFFTDLARELQTNSLTNYDYLAIYETLGYEKYAQNLRAYRQRIKGQN